MNTTPSPSRITALAPHQIFVYGSNEAGRHGAGAAALALKWGAVLGRTTLCGQTYGISTKDKRIETLPLITINQYVAEFLALAAVMTNTEFLVTEIGCGLAGLTPEDVAPMFRLAPDNVRLPQRFIAILTDQPQTGCECQVFECCPKCDPVAHGREAQRFTVSTPP